ncbi:hypothetical protein D3C73_1023160 [compost metagenome]
MVAGRVDLGQVPLRQTVEAQQQVIVILLQIRLGAGNQRVEILRLIVEWLENRKLHIQPFFAHHPFGFLDHRGHGAVGELRIERCESDLLVPLGRQSYQHRLNRWLAITHRQLHRTVGPPGSHGVLQPATEHHQRRALLPPDRRVGVS